LAAEPEKSIPVYKLVKTILRISVSIFWIQILGLQ